MKISVNFKTDKLPLAYRMPVLSIIKEAIRKGEPAVYRKYFENGQVPKPYATALYLQNFKLNEHDITLSGFQLNFTTDRFEILLPFLNGLQRTPTFTYKDNYIFKRGTIQFAQQHQQITSERIIVTTLSPILVEDGLGNPVAPFEPHFNQHFNAISNRLSKSLRGYPLQREVTITPISTKKRVIKEFLQSRNSDSRYLFFTAYHGHFVLEGDLNDLQWMVDVGVGLRRGQSFGMLAMEMEVNI